MRIPTETAIDLSDCFGDMTMRVKIEGVKKFRIKIKVAMCLLWLTSKLLKCGIEFHTEDEND